MAYPIHYDVTRGRHAGGPPSRLQPAPPQGRRGARVLPGAAREPEERCPPAPPWPSTSATSHAWRRAARGRGVPCGRAAGRARPGARRAGAVAVALRELSLRLRARRPLARVAGCRPTVPRGRVSSPRSSSCPGKSSAMQSIDTGRGSQDRTSSSAARSRPRPAGGLPAERFSSGHAVAGVSTVHEGELRTHFSPHFLELVLADVVARHLDGFPSSGRPHLHLPLRSTARRSAFSSRCGRDPGPRRAATGLHSRSRTGSVSTTNRARPGSRRLSGQVTMVGDWGRHARPPDLDLHQRARERAFPDVADSVRLGGTPDSGSSPPTRPALR